MFAKHTCQPLSNFYGLWHVHAPQTPSWLTRRCIVFVQKPSQSGALLLAVIVAIVVIVVICSNTFCSFLALNYYSQKGPPTRNKTSSWEYTNFVRIVDSDTPLAYGDFEICLSFHVTACRRGTSYKINIE